MKEVALKMLERAKALLESGEVARVIGWKKGDFCYDPVPASFESVEELDSFTYDYFCGANLSKYLIQMSKKEGKTAVFLNRAIRTALISLSKNTALIAKTFT